MTEKPADHQPEIAKNEKTHVTVILDRSGSMETIRDDTIGGFNAFLGEQKKVAGSATLTLVQFDTENAYEVIHQMTKVADVPELTAATPLLDALGRGIADLEAQLAALPAAEAPGTVIFAVITDGMENSSKEFRRKDIEQQIDRKTKESGWQFVFLSADLGAIEEAVNLGVPQAAALAFVPTRAGTSSAWSSLSKQVTDSRRGARRRIGFEAGDRQRAGDRRPA